MNDEAASRLTEVEYGCVLKEIHAERERVAGYWRPLARIAAPDTRCDITVQELVDLLKGGLHKLEDVMVRVILPPEFITGDFGRRVRKKCTVSDDSPRKPSFLTKDSILRFQVGLAVDGELLTQEELQELATLREPLIRIRGKWLYLDATVRGELEKIAQNVLNQSMRTISACQAVGELLRDELREAAGANAILSDVTIQADGLCILLDAFRSQTPPEVTRPQGLNADLRPYQVAGMNWMVMLGDFGIGGCLADDMGLGKTVQTLAWLLHQRQNGISAPALLICPTSVMCNWEKEAQKFAPSLNVIRHHGPNRPGNVSEFSTRTRSADLVVTSFSLLSRDLNLFHNVTKQWSAIILDEAQNIKNPNTAVSKAACDLSVSGATRLALTGTPVENGPRDLWPIMEFLNPGMLGTLYEYDKNIASPIEHGKDSDHRQKLKEKIKPFILRRVKTDPGIAPDLPPKIEQIVWCTLTREQAAWYQAALNNMRSALQSRDARERKGAILKVLLQLKLACNGVASLQKDRSDIYSRSGKIERLADMLASVVVNGEKALVFSQYPSQFERLRALLMQRLASELGRPVDVLTITGDDSVAAREETQRLFAESERVSVILISLKAGGTGLNLQSATHVFHLDRWWNAAVEDQATDRAWRIGQTQTVFAYKLVCRGTLEERIDALISKRRELAGDLLGDSNEESVIRELMKLDGEALQRVLRLAEDEALSDDAETTGDEEQFEIDRTVGFSV